MPFQKRTLMTNKVANMRPFVGPVSHTVSIPVTIANLATGEVDDNGWCVPGVPLARDGGLVGVGEDVYGCIYDAVRVALSGSATDRTAAGVVDITVGLICTVNKAILEDNLGRVLTADEIAGFQNNGGDSGCILLV